MKQFKRSEKGMSLAGVLVAATIFIVLAAGISNFMKHAFAAMSAGSLVSTRDAIAHEIEKDLTNQQFAINTIQVSTNNVHAALQTCVTTGTYLWPFPVNPPPGTAFCLAGTADPLFTLPLNPQAQANAGLMPLVIFRPTGDLANTGNWLAGGFEGMECGYDAPTPTDPQVPNVGGKGNCPAGYVPTVYYTGRGERCAMGEAPSRKCPFAAYATISSTCNDISNPCTPSAATAGVHVFPFLTSPPASLRVSYKVVYRYLIPGIVGNIAPKTGYADIDPSWFRVTTKIAGAAAGTVPGSTMELISYGGGQAVNDDLQFDDSNGYQVYIPPYIPTCPAGWSPLAGFNESFGPYCSSTTTSCQYLENWKHHHLICSTPIKGCTVITLKAPVSYGWVTGGTKLLPQYAASKTYIYNPPQLCPAGFTEAHPQTMGAYRIPTGTMGHTFNTLFVRNGAGDPHNGGPGQFPLNEKMWTQTRTCFACP